jgi:hypothetical protein
MTGTAISLPQHAALDPFWRCNFLMNGGSKEMTINGAPPPAQNFDYAATGGQTLRVTTLKLFLRDTGTQDPTRFGAIAGGLATGVQVGVVRNGVMEQIFNLKDNMDIALCLPEQAMQALAAGFMNSAGTCYQWLNFNPPILLQGARGDIMRAVIRDNLTAIEFMRMAITGWE